MPLDLKREPNIYTHQGFLLAEDEALKTYLSGITVPGREPAAPRVPVGLWFRWPEGERQVKYPFITLDLTQVEPAYDLFHSDHWLGYEDLYQPSYSPTVPTPPAGMRYNVRNYLPFRLTYQVAVHSRSALHDRYLQSIFHTDYLPARPFWIWCDTDETWRRTELLQDQQAHLSETTESGTKRIFRRVYTVSMMAEVPQDRLADSALNMVSKVLIEATYLDWFERFHQRVIDDHPDPIDEFTQAEREAQGELFHITHEGAQVPPPAHVTALEYGAGPYGVGPYGGTP